MAIEDELYQEILLEHYRATRNRRQLAEAEYSEQGHNPACGDLVTLFVQAGGRDAIGDVCYQGQGCAICCASANMLCEFVTGISWDAAERLYTALRAMLVSDDEVQFDALHEDLEALRGVRKFPLRIKCALLPWSALANIIQEYRFNVLHS